MATAQNVTNLFYLQKVSSRCIFKVRKFQLDTLNRFRMAEEKQNRGVFLPPPSKIGLNRQSVETWHNEKHYSKGNNTSKNPMPRQETSNKSTM